MLTAFNALQYGSVQTQINPAYSYISRMDIQVRLHGHSVVASPQILSSALVLNYFSDGDHVEEHVAIYIVTSCRLLMRKTVTAIRYQGGSDLYPDPNWCGMSGVDSGFGQIFHVSIPLKRSTVAKTTDWARNMGR
jgi:hypothetical protein